MLTVDERPPPTAASAPLTRRNETNDWSPSPSLLRWLDRKDRRTKRVIPSLPVRRCGRLKIELFLPPFSSSFSSFYPSFQREQTVKRGFRFVVQRQVTLSRSLSPFGFLCRPLLNGIVVKNKKKSKQRFWREGGREGESE